MSCHVNAGVEIELSHAGVYSASGSASAIAHHRYTWNWFGALAMGRPGGGPHTGARQARIATANSAAIKARDQEAWSRKHRLEVASRRNSQQRAMAEAEQR